MRSLCAKLLILLLGLVSLMPVNRAVAASPGLAFDTNRVMALELQIAPADWKALRYQHREAEFFPEETKPPPTNAYTWFKAEATVDGKRFGPVQVRKKGYIGSNDAKRPALKVRFAADTQAKRTQPDAELTLNNNSQDPALIRQSISYEIFRRAGVPAPRCAFALLTVNGNALGIYTRVETINEAFLRDRFGRADGNLYEGGRSDFRPGWFQNFEIKHSHETNRRADLERVTKAVEHAPGSLLPVVDQFFDAEEFFRFWAVESLINQSDGYAGNMNNFYLYHHPATDKFVFIPWGADSSLYSGRGLNRTKGDPKSVIGVSILANRLYKSAEGADRYRSTLRHVLDEAWKEELLLQEVNRLETLLAPHTGSRSEEFKQNVEGVRRFISGRRAEILPELQGPAPELQSQPLEIAKRRNVGHFEGRFKTAWGVVDPSSTNSPGAAELSGKLWGKELTFDKVIAQAGGMGGGSSPEQQPMIAFTATTTPGGKQFVIYLSVDSDCYEAGSPVAIDNTHIFGGCMEMDLTSHSSKMIGMLRGQLLLKSAGREPNGEIEGRFEADVFSKLPKP